MLLAFDTSTAACTAALFDEEGTCLGSRNELIGRGHAERLVPMIAELLDGRRADRILVGVGPGKLHRDSGRDRGGARPRDRLGSGARRHVVACLARGRVRLRSDIAVAMAGGHGELFVQQFDGGAVADDRVANLAPVDAAAT